MGLSTEERAAHAARAEVTFANLMQAARTSRDEAPDLPAYIVLTQYGQTLAFSESQAKSAANLFAESLKTPAIIVAVIAVHAP